jgi:hypothetical protein
MTGSVKQLLVDYVVLLGICLIIWRTPEKVVAICLIIFCVILRQALHPPQITSFKAFEEWLGEKYFYLLQMQLYGLNNNFFASHI